MGYPGGATESERAQVVAVVCTVDCTPVCGVPVALEGPTLLNSLSGTSDKNGLVIFNTVSPGNWYQLYANCDEAKVGYLPVRRKAISVKAGQVQVVPLVVSRANQ
jgi:hypothetical protein